MRAHGFTARGLSVPVCVACAAPLILSASSGLVVWRGVAGAEAYKIERSTAGPSSGFSTAADNLTDNDCPWTDTSGTGGAWYRITAYNGDAVASVASDVVQGVE